MKRIIVSFLCSAVVCAVVLPAGALAAEKGINAQERRQRARIRQGVRSGELTRQEALRLKAEEARIRNRETRARVDGTVTAAERERLEKELNKASHDIYEQKHDEQER